MTSEEQEIREKIDDTRRELADARYDLKEARRKSVDAETRTIDAKITLERLVEQLRRINGAKVVEGESYALYDDEEGSG